MNEIAKETKLEYKILKHKIENAKKRKNSIKNKMMTPHKKRKLKLLQRPKSNYLPNKNKIIEEEKISKIYYNLNESHIRKSKNNFVNKSINTSFKNENNISSIINQSKKINNYIYQGYENEFSKPRNSERKIINQFKTPKSAINRLKINKSFLYDSTFFNKINENFKRKDMQRHFSPRNDSYKNKYLKITKELFNKKYNNRYISPNSPSTAYNSNIFNDNSYSSHFLFGKSSLNSNMNKKLYNSNIIMDNRNIKNYNETSKIMTSSEYDLNKLLISSRESNNKNRNNKSTKNTKVSHNFNFEDFYRKFAKNIDENSLKDTFSKDTQIKENFTVNSHKKEKNIINNSINDMKSDKEKKMKKENNTKNNNYRKMFKNKNANLIIKYAFLGNAIHKITRKVDFYNPKNRNEIKLDTENIIYEENKEEDFTTYGYEMNPENIYKYNKKNLRKSKTIRISGEKEEIKYYKENEDKKIMPKYYLYHKIEVKNTEEKYIPDINNNEIEKLKNKNNFSNNILNIDSFGLGESIYKNRINYNKIKKEDKEEGKKLWKKLNNSSMNIYSDTRNKIKKHKKIEIKKEKIFKRINSAKISNKELNSNKLNTKKTKELIQNDIKNGQKIFIRRNNKKHLTEKINTLEQHKLFRNERGFSELKKNNNNIYDIDFKITDEEENEDEDEEIKIKSKFEESKMKETGEISENKENKEIEEKNIENNQNENKKQFKRRNTKADFGQFVSKLYKFKRKNSKKENYIINKNSNFKTKIKEQNKEIENKIYRPSIPLNIYSNKTPKPKIKYTPNIEKEKFRFKLNKTREKKDNNIQLIPKSKKEIKNNNTISINVIRNLKNKSFDLSENPILDELYSSIDLSEEEKNFTEDSDIINDNNKFDKFDSITKRKIKRKSTMIFDKYFKNYKWKYIEDEKMKKYFNDLFNKYGKEEKDEELVDIKFFGYNFKIKRKNQKNFKIILLNNIRLEEKIKKENDILNRKLNLILNKYKKKNNFLKNKDLYNSSILFRRHRKTSKRNHSIIRKKEKTKSKESLFIKSIKKEEEEEEDNDKNFNSELFKGIKSDSKNELEKKKEELLENMEDEIKNKINRGEVYRTEMDNFLTFQKRLNAYQINPNQNKKIIKILEHELISFQEELKIREQKKREEKRLNNFINEMNYDIKRKIDFKNKQKNKFCNVVDYKEKNNMSILSPTNEYSRFKNNRIDL